MGAAVDPQKITQALGIQPDFQANVGNRTPPRSDPRREGMWLVKSEGCIASTDLEQHVTLLLDRLPENFSSILPPGSRCDMHCIWWSATGHGGPELSSATLARLGALSLTLDFDIYFEHGDIDVFVDFDLPPPRALPVMRPGNANCESTFATLRIGCGEVDPDVLTQALGVPPDFQMRRGERRHGRGAPYRQGMWSLHSGALVQSNELEDHVLALLRSLPEDFGQRLPDGCSCDFFCYWESATGHGGPVFAPATLALLGQHGIALGLDFYSSVETAADGGEPFTKEK